MRTLREKEKLGYLVHELTNYYLINNIYNINIDINMDKDCSIIIISGSCKLPPKDIEEVIATLNHPRDRSMENYYEQLLGIHDNKNNFTLLSMMVDEAKLSIENDKLVIKIKRAF